MRYPIVLLAAAAALLATGMAIAGSVEVDFNPKAEFERYKTWGWVPDRDKGHYGVLADETMRERVERGLTARLESVGLHPAAEGETPDLLVRYRGDIGTGKTVNTSAGSIVNYVDAGYVTTQFQEQNVTLIVDLIDQGSKALAWRLYVDQEFGGPNDTRDKLRKALDKGFSRYPPSQSQRAKKARELEKQKAK